MICQYFLCQSFLSIPMKASENQRFLMFSEGSEWNTGRKRFMRWVYFFNWFFYFASTTGYKMFWQLTVLPCKFDSPDLKGNLIYGTKYSRMNQVSLVHSWILRPIQCDKLCKRVASRVAERLRIFENKEIKTKFQDWVGAQATAKSSLQKLIFGNSGQNLRKSRYQSFQPCLVSSDFHFFVKYFVTDFIAYAIKKK